MSTQDDFESTLTAEITNHIREVEHLSATITDLQMLTTHHVTCLHECLDKLKNHLGKDLPEESLIRVRNRKDS